MKKAILTLSASILILLPILYLLGPHPAKPTYTLNQENLLVALKDLDSYVAYQEKLYAPIKPGNEARIVWANDTVKSKTPYALIYLHGFSASHEEGNPIHEWMAKRYGMNLYLPRLADHGRISDQPLGNYTAEQTWIDATKALTIGKLLGEKVIILSTSTGGTLSLLLSAHDSSIHAQILMSPNIAVNDSKAWLLNNPWGLHIARQVIGGDYRYAGDSTEPYIKYWNYKYRIEALTELQELIETSMLPATFHAIHQPTLLMYYYKDEQHQDPVVRVDAMLKMYDELATASDKKHKVAMPNVDNHVMGSYIKSHDLESVKKEITEFVEHTLLIKPIDQ